MTFLIETFAGAFDVTMSQIRVFAGLGWWPGRPVGANDIADGPSALKPLQKAAGFAPACVMAAAAISNARRHGGGNRDAHARGAQAARLVVFAAARARASPASPRSSR